MPPGANAKYVLPVTLTDATKSGLKGDKPAGHFRAVRVTLTDAMKSGLKTPFSQIGFLRKKWGYLRNV